MFKTYNRKAKHNKTLFDDDIIHTESKYNVELHTFYTLVKILDSFALQINGCYIAIGLYKLQNTKYLVWLKAGGLQEIISFPHCTTMANQLCPSYYTILVSSRVITVHI